MVPGDIILTVQRISWDWHEWIRDHANGTSRWWAAVSWANRPSSSFLSGCARSPRRSART